MQTVGDLLATLKLKPQDIAHSDFSPLDRLDRLSAEELRELGRVVVPSMVECWDTPLGEMLSGLFRCRSQSLKSPPLMVRNYYVLRRAGVTTWGDVAKLTLGQLYKIWNMGMPAIINIVTCSLEQSLRSHQADDATEDRDTEDLDREFDKSSKFHAKEEDSSGAH